MDKLLDLIRKNPNGISPAEVERHLSVSRATVNRMLRSAVGEGLIIKSGNGPSTIYCDADPLLSIRAYFEKPDAQRSFAIYHESLLQSEPSLTASADDFVSGKTSLGRKDLTRFLIDFACASSVLEGGTYSLLDTQALIQYGEKAKDRPLADAALVLNHKDAFEYLYDNFASSPLTIEGVVEINKRLTNDHDIQELKNAAHFLDKESAGRIREHREVNIAHSAYAPPFRPGTKYIAKMLERILTTSQQIKDPLKNSFYLLTRLPYLQPFEDGNKRTSRVICNAPLLNAGLPPISFVDFVKKDYILSMLAFYELGDIRMAEKCFVDAYTKSRERLTSNANARHQRAPR